MVRNYLERLQMAVIEERGGNKQDGKEQDGNKQDGREHDGKEHGGKEWLIRPPSWRGDVTLEADLIEEAARLYGYDKIGATLPTGGRQSGPARTPSHRLRRELAHFMAGQGFLEIIPYSFIHPNHLDRLRVPEDHPWRDAVVIMNPLSEDQGIMRTTMLPSLLDSAAANLNRQNRNPRLFEIGKIYRKNPDPSGHPEEIWSIGAVCTGGLPKSWLGGDQKYDFYYLKGVLEALLRKIDIPNPRFAAADDIPGTHPGRCARIRSEGQTLGFLGEIHPKTAGDYGLDQRSVAFCLDAEVLLTLAGNRTYHPTPRYPALTRDLALTVPVDIPAQEILDAMVKLGGETLREARLFDVYQGEQIAHGSKSVAFALTWQSLDRTLTDQEVGAQMERIETGLKNLFQGQIRGR
jgi:phenylalanyl-tRNA synthetase beta chain